MQEYRFKFYLNAMHSILIGDAMGEVHPHTWEIVVDVFKQNNGFITFTEVEKPIDALLRPFQNKNMNTISPFDTINPTLENVTIYLQNELETMFVANGFIMTRIEVSETPSRTFVIDIRNDDNKYNSLENIEVVFDSEIAEKEAEKVLDEKTHAFRPDMADGFAETDKVNYSYKRYENKRKVRKNASKLFYLLSSVLLIAAIGVISYIVLMILIKK